MIPVSSNHLDIMSIWKLLVASCVCVWLKFECTFSVCLAPALKCSSSSIWKLV